VMLGLQTSLRAYTGTRKQLHITLGGTDMALRIVLNGLLGCAFLAVAAADQTVGCVLDTASNGGVVKIRGEVSAGGHDLFIRPEGCWSNRVILIYGDDPSLGKAKLSIRRDEPFRRFEKYLNEEQAPRPNQICRQCMKYRVTGEFEGRLEITASAGLKRDPKTGKVVGMDGFGHPVPFSRFRLVFTSVSNVEAVERK